MQIKQYIKVKNLGRILFEETPGEAMALSFINKTNNKLKFHHQKNRFLTPSLT